MTAADADIQKMLIDAALAPGGVFDGFIEGVSHVIVKGRTAYINAGGGDPDGAVAAFMEGLLTRIYDRVDELVERES